MSDTILIEQQFNVVNALMHLPGKQGPMLQEKCAVVKIGAAAFAHPGFDAGASVLVCVGNEGNEALVQLDIGRARHFLSCVTAAIAEAEKLQ